MVKKTCCFINESSNYKLGRLDNKFWTFTQRVYHFWNYMIKKTRCFRNDSSNYKLGRLDNRFWTFTQRVYHFWIYMVKKTYWWHISLEPSPVWLVYPLCHGCFPLGPPSLGNHCKQWEWGITSRAKGQRCTNTHTNRSHWYFCIVESRTLQHMAMAPRFNRGLSVRHHHFWAILVDFSSVQQFDLCKAHL